ncbi:spore coat protein U [Ewingella americana]|jgi:spore coat protein U-like protein|nr:spore coat protein U [Ewingella americana]
MNLLRIGLRALAALALLVVGLPSAYAACSSSPGTGSFGTLSSFVAGSTAQQVTATSGFKCSGSLLSLLGTNTVTATIATSANGVGTQAAMLGPNGVKLPYQICQDNGCGTVVNLGSSTTWSSTTLLGLLGLFNASDGSLPLYLRTVTGVNLPAGSYSDTLGINWTYHICFIGVLGLCVYTDGADSTTVTVNMTVTNFCYIDNAPNVNFGSAAFPAGFASVTNNSLSIRCTLNAAYSVNLTSTVPGSGQYRQMSSTNNGVTSYLQYQIFKGDASVWTAATNTAMTGTGASQNVAYSATVNPSQANPPPGTYSDTVLVTVTY